MENMYILKSNNSIIFNHGNINEVVFNFKEYKDILNNLSTEKYDFFKIIHEKYNIKNEKFKLSDELNLDDVLRNIIISVSYTHLDVYKRQTKICNNLL